MGDMAYARDCGREGLGGMNACGSRRRRDPDAYQDRARDLPEGHAERAIDELGGEADQSEDEERRRIGEDLLEDRLPPLRFARRLPKCWSRCKRMLQRGNSIWLSFEASRT
jgi:hypothetical protein